MHCYTESDRLLVMAKRRKGPTYLPWDGARVRALRRHLGVTQTRFAQDLGMRQQTISEWETGLYQPRGASRTLLTLIAERARFPYQAQDPTPAPPAATPEA